MYHHYQKLCYYHHSQPISIFVKFAQKFDKEYCNDDYQENENYGDYIHEVVVFNNMYSRQLEFYLIVHCNNFLQKFTNDNLRKLRMIFFEK